MSPSSSTFAPRVVPTASAKVFGSVARNCPTSVSAARAVSEITSFFALYRLNCATASSSVCPSRTISPSRQARERSISAALESASAAGIQLRTLRRARRGLDSAILLTDGPCLDHAFGNLHLCALIVTTH